MNVTVVGLGKIGLPLAAALANGGAHVVGTDTDVALVEGLTHKKRKYPGEPGLDQLLASLTSEWLSFTSDTSAAVAKSEVTVVLVRLALDHDGAPDYSDIDAATEAIGNGLTRGHTVIYETTLPPGDTRTRFTPALERISGMRSGKDFYVAFSPERVSSGSVLADLKNYPKVVGGLDDNATKITTELYSSALGVSILQLSIPEAAELAKISEALYRDVNIALANEIAKFADAHGIDYSEVAAAANSQPFSHLHQPGLGVGGHCIPVYPRFFISATDDASLTRAGRDVNDTMPAHAVTRLESIFGSLSGTRVLILGLAFRRDVPETTLSMAFQVALELKQRGAVVRVHDAVLGKASVESQGMDWGEPGEWAEVVIVQAMHSAYDSLTPDDFGSLRLILDGRGVLDPQQWSTATVSYIGIGRR